MHIGKIAISISFRIYMDHSIAWYSKTATKIPIQYSVTMLFCFCYGGCKVVIKLSAICWLCCHPFFSLSFAKNILTNNNRLWTPNIFSNIPNVFAAWADVLSRWSFTNFFLTTYLPSLKFSTL